MRMRVLLALATLAATAAHADTLRCGSSLISTGDSQASVLQKCGQPDSKREVKIPVMARNPDGYVFQTGETTQDIWWYRRSPGSFPATLTFEGGVLKKLEFQK